MLNRVRSPFDVHASCVLHLRLGWIPNRNTSSSTSQPNGKHAASVYMKNRPNCYRRSKPIRKGCNSHLSFPLRGCGDREFVMVRKQIKIKIECTHQISIMISSEAQTTKKTFDVHWVDPPTFIIIKIWAEMNFNTIMLPIRSYRLKKKDYTFTYPNFKKFILDPTTLNELKMRRFIDGTLSKTIKCVSFF